MKYCKYLLAKGLVVIKHLKQQIKEFTEKAGGTWGIVIEDMDKDLSWGINDHELFYAASVIKVPIMAATYALADQGEINLSDLVILEREDLVGGSGVLQHLSPGMEISIYDLLMLMIIQSDNSATNILIDIVGVPQIQQTIKDLGMSKSTFFTKLMTVPVNPPGRNMITAADMNLHYKKLLKGDYISSYACEQMIHILKRQQIRTGLPAYLPTSDSDVIGTRPEWEVAHKTGNVTGIQHDGGIFYVKDRTVIVTVLSKGCDRFTALDTAAKIGKSVYHYMKGD